MRSYIPAYLLQKNNVVLNVLGTALFAEIFIAVFQPFGSRGWLPDGPENGLIYFASATVVVLVAMGIIAISRTIMYKYGKTHRITYMSYALWILAEVIAMSLIYTLAVLFVYNIFPTLVASSEKMDFMNLLGKSMLYTAFILFIPYSVFILYFALVDTSHQLQMKILESDGQSAEPDKPQVFNFTDEKNDFAISISDENLYYIVAADNYVDIVYLNSGKLKHFMLRQSLKNIEEQFAGRGIVRCHRSYMVNLRKVKILRRDDMGLTIDFDNPQLQTVPVSKTYGERLTRIFMG